jgi:hypothetical protein
MEIKKCCRYFCALLSILEWGTTWSFVFPPTVPINPNSIQDALGGTGRVSLSFHACSISRFFIDNINVVLFLISRNSYSPPCSSTIRRAYGLSANESRAAHNERAPTEQKDTDILSTCIIIRMKNLCQSIRLLNSNRTHHPSFEPSLSLPFPAPTRIYAMAAGTMGAYFH